MKASKEDESIKIFSEQNNMYRSFISMIILFLVLKLYEAYSPQIEWLKYIDEYILLILLIILFIFSYVKQNNYIKKRVSISKK